MRRQLAAGALLTAIAASGLSFARGGHAPDVVSAAAAFHCPIHGDDPQHPLPIDVRHAMPLPGDGLAAAARAAFLQMTHAGPPKNRSRHGSWIVSAVRGDLSNPALKLRDRACGHHLGRRSVDVTLHYATAFPSASLSLGNVFVARYRLPSGRIRYLVWQVMH